MASHYNSGKTANSVCRCKHLPREDAYNDRESQYCYILLQGDILRTPEEILLR